MGWLAVQLPLKQAATIQHPATSDAVRTCCRFERRHPLLGHKEQHNLGTLAPPLQRRAQHPPVAAQRAAHGQGRRRLPAWQAVLPAWRGGAGEGGAGEATKAW